MATQVLPGQLGFPWAPEPEPLPTELHSLSPKIASPGGKAVNTILRYTKWAKVPVGHFIELTEGDDHRKTGVGVVTRVWTGIFKEVSAKVLDRNHTGPKTYSEVLTAMRNAYGAFREDEYVIFLDYRRIS